jgi:hypothetical protein
MTLLAVPAHVAAGTAEPIVTRDYVPEMTNTLPYVGCNGEPVMVTFDGWLRVTAVMFPDSTTNLKLKSQEQMSWEEAGVVYTADINFTLVESTRVGDIVSVVTNGRGTGSDGSTVRHHAIVHLTIGPDGTVHRDIVDGWLTCS